MAFQVLQATSLASQAAGTDITLVLGIVPVNFAQGTWLPARVSLTSPALLTGATATAITFTFQNRRANTVIGTIASLVTSTGVNLAAGIETVLAAGAVTSVLAGDQIECALTHASTGTAYSSILARVELV
jgi:hypothetical protein